MVLEHDQDARTLAKARGMRPLQDITTALGLMNVLYLKGFLQLELQCIKVYEPSLDRDRRGLPVPSSLTSVCPQLITTNIKMFVPVGRLPECWTI